MDKIKVLFVDDDVTLGNIVMMALNASGYEAHYQTSLTAIRSVIQELKPDIIILDVEIGKKNGIDATPEIKAIVPDTPILFVSSHVDSSEVVKALNAGGMAYLKKPFEIEELLAYIQRHSASFHSKGIQAGCFTLNTEENLLMKKDEVVKKLSLFECKLLKLLALNMNQPVTREQIERELWEDGYSSEQSLNNYIAKLRKYLSEDNQLELVTIPKIGYKLVKQE
nr:response regulator transcription factor [Parabacteroides goldsteinii]